MNKWTYYSNGTEVTATHGVKNAKFLEMGGVPNKHNYYDSYSRLVGHTTIGPDEILPVTRKVIYNKNGSLHKCDSRCLNATGHNCECSCGGLFHGAGTRA